MRLKAKVELGPRRPRGQEFVAAQRDVAVEAEVPAGLLKPGFQKRCERAETALPTAELRIVKLAAAQLP